MQYLHPVTIACTNTTKTQNIQLWVLLQLNNTDDEYEQLEKPALLIKKHSGFDQRTASNTQSKNS